MMQVGEVLTACFSLLPTPFTFLGKRTILKKKGERQAESMTAEWRQRRPLALGGLLPARRLAWAPFGHSYASLPMPLCFPSCPTWHASSLADCNATGV